MTDLRDYKVGQLIELNDGRQGTVRFVGQTSFAPGDWIGVEFEDASGKNDGSVQGERYFDCDMGHGMFLRPTGVASILQSPTPKPAKKPAANNSDATTGTDKNNAKLPGPRTSTVGVNAVKKKTTAVDPTASRRATMNATTPTPETRRTSTLNGVKSPTKLAARTVGSTATSSAASSRGPTPSATRKPLTKPATTTRSSLAPAGSTASTTTKPSSTTASRPTRPSVAPKVAPKPSAPSSRPTTASPRPTTSSSSKPAQISPTKPKTAPNGTVAALKQESRAGVVNTSENDADESELPQEDGSPNDEVPDVEPELESKELTNGHGAPEEPEPAKSKPAPKTELQPAQKTAALNRKVEEYEAKMKLLEKKRSEDVEKLANLEKLQAEKERLEKIVQTLQNKLKPQSQELASTKSRVKELEEQIDKNETQLADHEGEMEMAMLDREMAEETAESLKLELDALRQKQEELELEVEVLRDENAEFGKETSAEDRSSQGWLQLERQSERYREALVRLRDISQSTEAELKEQITALEEDLKSLDDVQKQHAETKQQLEDSEAAIENLKQQLDAAMASEDMVEELTENNNELTEENRKLRVEIDELQTINELNDEFEEQHLENEKLMQEEIETRGAALLEQTNRVAKQDEKLAEYEYTINKFREVVSSLQSHIEDLKTSQQISDAEADELNARSKAMTDLNMKLQSSAAKAQNSTVDIEMRRLEAQEAADHLAVVVEFLPEGFQPEQNSVQVYLRFKRIAFKARLLYDLFKDRLSGNAFNVPTDMVFVSYQILDKLLWISSSCDRFVNDITGCTPERFSNYEEALHELDPVERGLNGYIESWRRQELREKQMDEELRRTVSVLTHLSEVYIQSSLDNFAEELVMKTGLMQNHLDTTSAVLTSCKSLMARKSLEEGDEVAEDEEQINYNGQLNDLIALSRSAKIMITKTLTSIKDLKERSMSLTQDTNESFSAVQSRTFSVVNFGISLGLKLHSVLDDPASSDTPHEASIRAALNDFRVECFPDSSSTSDPLVAFNTYLRQTSSEISSINSLAVDLSRTTEFTRQPLPWIMRAQALKTASESNSAAEAEVQRLKNLLNERVQAVRAKDQSLEEQNVKIELLEARMRDAHAKAGRIEELQSQVNAYKKREREMMEEVEKKFREADNLKVERDRWKAAADTRQPMGSPELRGHRARTSSTISGGTTIREIEALKVEIKGLQEAVNYLRNDNFKARSPDAARLDEMHWLKDQLVPSKTIKQQKEKREKVMKEGSDVLRSLLYLATSSKLVDLSTLPANKLAWRPTKEKNSWVVAKQAEEWEIWRGKKKAFLDKATTFVAPQQSITTH